MENHHATFYNLQLKEYIGESIQQANKIFTLKHDIKYIKVKTTMLKRCLYIVKNKNSKP